MTVLRQFFCDYPRRARSALGVDTVLTFVEGGLGAVGVRYGAAAEIRVVSVTSLLSWAVTISANVN